MAAQKGRDVLLKLDATSTGSFQTVAGLRVTRLSFDAGRADTTTADSPGGWRELLAGAAPKSASISGAGIFKDATSDAQIRQIFFDGSIVPWRVILPDFGTIEGPFQLTALEYAGEHDGEARFDLSLASAGAIAFTAA